MQKRAQQSGALTKTADAHRHVARLVRPPRVGGYIRQAILRASQDGDASGLGVAIDDGQALFFD